MSDVTSGPIEIAAAQPRPGRSLALAIGMVVVLALVAMFGWKMFDTARGQV